MISACNKPESGFSLIEILVALVILSAVSVVAMNVSSTALEQTHYLQQKMFAPWIAENRLTRIRIALHHDLALSLKDEKLSTANINWLTQVKVVKSTQSLTRVSVIVSLADSPENSVYSLDGYFPSDLIQEEEP